MTSSSELGAGAPPDDAVLRRVQQLNQRQILSQLLHDLRNPVHSIRITMELFGRIARRNGDLEKLLDRAATYIVPAEAALANLLVMNERLGVYLANPVAPSLAPLSMKDWLAEIALLLRTSKRRLQVTCAPAEIDPSWRLVGDRVRLSQAVLQYCLGSGFRQVMLAARDSAEGVLHIDVSFGPEELDAELAPDPRSPLTVEELRVLIENAGGSVTTATNTQLSLSFPRSAG